MLKPPIRRFGSSQELAHRVRRARFCNGFSRMDSSGGVDNTVVERLHRPGGRHLKRLLLVARVSLIFMRAR